MNLYPLPEEFKILTDKPVWGLFTKNESGKKYTIPILQGKQKQCSSNDSNTLANLDTVLHQKQPGQFVVLSIQLSNQYLSKALRFVDIDGEKDNFDPYLLTKFLKNPDTYAELSPSGRGYHIFYFTQKDQKLKKIDQKGYDTSDRGFVTVTFHPVAQLPIKTIAGETYQTKVDIAPMEPYYEGKLSLIWCFNQQNSIEDLLLKHNYIQRGKKFLYPPSTSGVPGVLVSLSSKGSWNVCYSFHHEDPLYGKIHDPFGVETLFAFKGNKRAALHELSKTTLAIDPDTGEILGETVHTYNSKSDMDNFDCEVTKTYTPPELSSKVLSLLPDPFPLLLHNFTEMIYDPVPAMYIPAFLSQLEVLLDRKFVTGRGRGVNNNYATGSESGGGKDDNSKDAIRRQINEIKKYAPTSNDAMLHLLDLMEFSSSTYTSGTTALRNLTAKGEDGLVNFVGSTVINTEATAFFKMIAKTENHNQSHEVMDIEIACFDGYSIDGRKITSNSNKDTPSIPEPNYSFLRYTQINAFMEAFNIEMLEKGYYGRVVDTYDLREDQGFVPSTNRSFKTFNTDSEGYDFLVFLSGYIRSSETPVIMVKTGHSKDSALVNWEMAVMKDIYNKFQEVNKDLWPGIKRVPQIGEKWITLVTAYSYLWALFKQTSIDHLVLSKDQSGKVITLDGTRFESCVLPMLDYLARAKYFNIVHNINGADASMIDKELDSIWSKLVAMTKSSSTKDCKTFGPWYKKGLIPCMAFNDKAKKSATLNKEITGRDKSEKSEKIERAIQRYMENKGLQRSEPIAATVGGKVRKKVCYVEKK